MKLLQLHAQWVEAIFSSMLNWYDWIQERMNIS
jgi:hypothetical protein